MKFYLRLISLLLLALAVQRNSQAQTVIIGRILDEVDSLPVPNTFVIAGKDTVLSDSLGKFVLLNSAKAKSLRVISRFHAPQSVTLTGENEYALTIVLGYESEKYVKRRKGDAAIKNINELKIEQNDTLLFSGKQGRFSAYILDIEDGTPLEGTTVYMKETEDGELADSTGFVKVLFAGDTQTITIEALGFHSVDTLIHDMDDAEPVKIYLKPLATDLDGVVVYAKKKRYRNKNNPAVALIRKVIDQKSENRMLNNTDVKYEVYDKMVMYVSNLPRIISRNFLFKPFRFIFENEDTTLIERRKLFPLFVSETMADHYYKAEGNKSGKAITSEKRIRFDSRNVESGNITNFLDRLYDQIDIYDDKIRVLDNFFLSPIAPIAPTFYKFFIVDTTEVSGRKIVQLRFEPRNSVDFLFEGRIFVTLEPEYAVTKVRMKVPKTTPLNWTNGLDINLDFEKQANGKYWQTRSYYLVNFGLFNSRRGVVGLRYIDKRDLQADPPMPDSVFEVKQATLEREGDTLYQKSNEFWEQNRPLPLSYFENKAYQNIDSLVKMKYYRNLMSWGYVMGTGMKPVGKFELGSIYDLFNYNPIEGFKLRVGGRTNIKKIQNFFVQGYAAYGFRDERLKYFLGGTYGLNKDYAFGFPMHNVHLSYQYDARAPGQPLGYATQEKPQDLIRRGDNTRYIYNGLLTARYTKEFQNRMTFTLQYINWQQEAAGSLYFERSDGSRIRDLSTNEFSLNWRYAPGERFIQNRVSRTYNNNQAWDFNLKLTAGFNDGYSTDPIAYQKLEMLVKKRFFIAPFGEVHTFITGGYLSGNVPYPYLFIPQGNQSYRFSVSMYNMMNFMEFASDRYVGLTIDYHMKGFLLNRIPLIRKMYLREVFGFKVIYGGLRNQNLPENNALLLKFPVDENGRSIVNAFGNVPYIEASVGLTNVVKVMRIDLVKRFTYLNLPHVAKNGLGIRFSFGLGF